MSKNTNNDKFSVNYIEPEDFHAEYSLSEKAGKPSIKLMLMFEKIARGYSRKFYSNNRCDTDAGISYASTEAWLKWNKYDKERSDNIFAFFTQMIKNDLKTYYNKITKYNKRNISLDAVFSGNKNNN